MIVETPRLILRPYTPADFPALYAYMTVGNEASWRTAEKCGLRRIHAYTDEDGERLYVYCITRKEWQRHQLLRKGETHASHRY